MKPCVVCALPTLAMSSFTKADGDVVLFPFCGMHPVDQKTINRAMAYIEKEEKS